MGSWIEGYKHTTLCFWEDKLNVSLEQFAAFAALFASSFYVLLISEYGIGKPSIGKQSYLFIGISIYVIGYFLYGGGLFLYSDNFLKLMRLVCLHITISMLFLSFCVSFHLVVKKSIDCVACSLLASSVIYIHTRRILKKRGIKKRRFVIVIGMALALAEYFLMYYFILPWQGSV